MSVIERAKRKYTFRIDNFTIMGNHFHLIIKPLGSASLSKIMQWIMGVFAMMYNRIHKLSGHLWGGRFFSRIISSLRDYIRICAYIDQNPVKSGLAVHPWDWLFCGLSHRRRGRRGIIDPLDACIALMLPSHAGLQLLSPPPN